MAIINGNDLDNVLNGDLDANINDTINGFGGNDVLLGLSGNDRLFGGAGADQLLGGSGADLLDGGSGADRLDGGLGDDVFVVDNAGDVVLENAGVGTGVDLVQSRLANITLAANVENLKVLDATIIAGPGGGLQFVPGGVNGTGNDLANDIEGNAGANVLSGGAGDDTLRGLGGNDTLNGDLGNDTLDGGAGVDTMNGGAGNDVYTVDAAGDVVSEGLFGGSDLVRASVSYTIVDNDVENLALLGTGNFDATGNAASNRLGGNSGDNVLDGRGGADIMGGATGNDTYRVDNVGDTVLEGLNGGNDAVVSSVSYTLAANVENLSLDGLAAITGTGNALNNQIVGSAANNTLSGLGGADALNGGDGNDTLLGGTEADALFGAGGLDTLQGGTGGDRLNGGNGNDVLRAVDNVFFVDDGAVDRFEFTSVLNAATNFDLIDKANFTAGGGEQTDDEIVLENSIFTALQAVGGGPVGTLTAGMYFEGAGQTGNAATAAVGIYNDTSTGTLYYNPTFGTAGDTVRFAVVNNAGVAGGSAVLSAEEFTLV